MIISHFVHSVDIPSDSHLMASRNLRVGSRSFFRPFTEAAAALGTSSSHDTGHKAFCPVSPYY